MNPKQSTEINKKKEPNIILSEESDYLKAKYNSNKEENYSILRGQVGPDVYDINGILEKYLTCSDKIIGMMDGSIPKRDLYSSEQAESKEKEESPDVVVWLDKSARPVSWLVSDLWEDFAQEGAKKPEYVFRNIDRIDWFVKQGYSAHDSATILGPSDFKIEKVSLDDITKLRALSVDGDVSEDNWRTETWEKPNSLDGKKIMIVDEMKNKGGTLAIAQQLFQKAYPTSKISGAYFWENGIVTLSNYETRTDSAPVWYRAENEFGRGVGDRSSGYYESLPDKPINIKLKLGQFVLSAPHFTGSSFRRVKDSKAELLRDDFKLLAKSYHEGKVLRIALPMLRGLEGAEKILEEQGLDNEILKTYHSIREKPKK